MKSVLIVEDEAVVFMDLQMKLVQLGYKVAGTADTGEKALKMLAESKPDIVLMDIGLSGAMDGIEAAVRMRELSEVPIVFVTAQSDSAIIQRSQACDPYGFIVKPSSAEILEATLTTALHMYEKDQRVKQSEALLEATEHMASSGGWDWDCEQHTMFWTNESYRIHDLDPADFISGSSELLARSLECFDPDDRPTVEAAFRSCVESGKLYDLELPFTTAKGHRLWVHTKAQAVREKGITVRVIGTIMDITERKQIENAQRFLLDNVSTRGSENFFQSLARYLGENLEMDYICIDRLGGDLRSARTVAIWFDGKFEDNVSYTLKDTPCGEVVDKSICCYDKDVRHMFPNDAVLQEMNAESYVGTLLHDSYGKPNGLIAMIGRKPLSNQHIPKTVLEQVAVVASNELEREKAAGELESIANIPRENPSPILRIEDGRVTFSNPSGMELLHSMGGEVGEPIPLALRELPQVVHANPGVTVTTFRHGGRIYECSVSPIEGKGYLNLYIVDITDRKLAEERLLRENQLDKALAGIYEPLMKPRISLDQIAIVILEWAKKVCRSAHGYVSVIDRDTGDNVGLTLTEMLAGKCMITGEGRRIRFPVGKDGQYPALFGYPLNTGTGFFTNDPKSYPASTGVPDGHIQLQGILSVPVFLEDTLAGQIALANPSTPYTEDDLQAIQRLANFYAIAIQRKRDEAALDEGEQRIRHILEHIDVYVYSVNYKDGQLKNRYYSSKCRDITGYEINDYEQDPDLWEKMIHEDDRPGVLEYVAAINAGKKLPAIEYRIIRKDGTSNWVMNTYTSELDEQGRVAHSQGVVIDISDRILMEHNLLVAKNAADAANRAKSDFLASMSHELRTPLNSILGFSQLLAMDESGTLGGRQKSYIQDIRNSGEHLLAMIGDILDLAKIEAGKIEIQKKPFDLFDMMNKLSETMQAQAIKKSVHLVLDVASDLGALEADEVRIRQVLYNLLSNAIKFTEPGKNVGLEARGEGNRIIIKVWDEGIGIPEEDKDRIFNPFEQVRQMNVANQGTGLGLSISQHLVELHGGRIDIQSKLGQGSCFIVSLPGRAGERRTDRRIPAAGRGVSSDGTGKISREILVVEDNPVNQKLMVAILNSCGLKATMASSGEEAVEIAGSSTFDLIFMDISLPGIDGIETMKRIRRLAAARTLNSRRKADFRTPIIALTAHAMQGDRERFIAEGMDDVLSKPIDIERFKTVLASHLHIESTPASPKPLVDRIGMIEGIDSERARLMFGDDKQFYSELLNVFATAYRFFPTDLLKAIGEGNQGEAHRIVHSLRGAAANLGISKVEASARSLEARFASGEVVSGDDTEIGNLARIVQATVAAIGMPEQTSGKDMNTRNAW